MTPVVKLVFGADYDKTRLTEYAAALTHAHRLQLPQGALGDYLSKAEGGLKGVVKAERRLRKEESGKAVEPIDAPRHALARKAARDAGAGVRRDRRRGSEFALVMIRRTERARWSCRRNPERPGAGRARGAPPARLKLPAIALRAARASDVRSAQAQFPFSPGVR
jgi:hypothetical protein